MATSTIVFQFLEIVIYVQNGVIDANDVGFVKRTFHVN